MEPGGPGSRQSSEGGWGVTAGTGRKQQMGVLEEDSTEPPGISSISLFKDKTGKI